MRKRQVAEAIQIVAQYMGVTEAKLRRTVRVFRGEERLDGAPAEELIFLMTKGYTGELRVNLLEGEISYVEPVKVKLRELMKCFERTEVEEDGE